MLNKNKFLFTGLAVLLVYLSPYIFNPGQSKFLIHDNLDSNVVWYKNLAESGAMFADNNTIIEKSMGGIPRGCYPGELNLMPMLYIWFSPLAAYCINIVLLHLIAFVGMYILSKKYIFKNASNFLPATLATLFSILPFWPSGGISIAGQPLLLWAFANIFFRDFRIINWAIIILFPLYSSLVFSNIFFIIAISIVYVLMCVKNKSINYYFLLGIFLFLSFSIVSEYRLFLMEFVEKFEHHRTAERGGDKLLNLKGLIGVSLLHFLKGHYHFASMQFPIIIVVTLFALIMGKKKERTDIVLFLLLLFSISIVNFLPQWSAFKSLISSFKILNTVQFRFISLSPLLWFIVFGLSMKALYYYKIVFGKYIAIVSAATVGGCLLFMMWPKDYFGSDTLENSFYKTYISKNDGGHQSFDNYYEVGIFDKIKQSVPQGDYYIVCLGMVPEIAQYNGYNTIGGYHYYFPKKAVTLMRQAQKEEYNKSGKKFSSANKQFFHSHDIETKKDTVKSLLYNFDLLKKEGAKYLFSSKPVISDSLLNEKIIVNENGVRSRMYVYEIK